VPRRPRRGSPQVVDPVQLDRTLADLGRVVGAGERTLSAFTAAFRATFGTTPGAYRGDMGRSAPV